MSRTFTVALAFALAACGGSATTLQRNRTGTGTGTLQVMGAIDATTSGGPQTTFAVDLQDGFGAAVSGATVTVHNADFQDVPLVEVAAGSGHYVNSRAAISNADFGLDVSHSKGSVQGVAAGNPGMQIINAPLANAIVPAGQALAVSWTTPVAAQTASVETRNMSQTMVPDTGTYLVAGTSNPPNTQQRLSIDRLNAVSIAGGIIGSQLTVTNHARVVYTVQ